MVYLMPLCITLKKQHTRINYPYRFNYFTILDKYKFNKQYSSCKQNVRCRFGLTKDQVRSLLPIINTENTEIGSYCPKELKSYPGNDCGDGINFRSIDGRCNNFVHPHWGAAKLPFKRLLPPDYGDGKFIK